MNVVVVYEYNGSAVCTRIIHVGKLAHIATYTYSVNGDNMYAEILYMSNYVS